MIEARITCVCPSVAVDDLKLRMLNGDIVYVDESEARRSIDLMTLARAGAITVRFVKRVGERRQPTAVVGKPKRTPPNFVHGIPSVKRADTTRSPTMMAPVVNQQPSTRLTTQPVISEPAPPEPETPEPETQERKPEHRPDKQRRKKTNNEVD